MTDFTTDEFQRQWSIITRGAVDVLPEDDFKQMVNDSIEGKRPPLRIKQGFDPTSPDIHLGHTVGIRKLRQFQDIGHQIVLIVGDFTSMVGDPSGQSATRPQLSYDEIMTNAKTYQDQFFRVLDKRKTEIRYNGEWFKKMDFEAIMKLAARFTVARMLEREDFSQRYKGGVPISIHEFFYPLMQGYDSVAIEANVEIGGTDQTFNLLAGRVIQEAYDVPAQSILTMPILVGLDGVKKMSKSLGNYIGIEEPPREIFGKAMSISDDKIYEYFELATDVTLEKLEEIKKALSSPDVNPMLVKKELGETLVDMYHKPGSGKAAREEFERVFSQKKLPDEIPELSAGDLSGLGLDAAKVYLVHLIVKAGLAKSASEARKLIKGGAVTIDDARIEDIDFEFAVEGDMILKVGKRRFLKLTT